MAHQLYVERMPELEHPSELELPDADRCPACGESVAEGAPECPDCGLALLPANVEPR